MIVLWACFTDRLWWDCNSLLCLNNSEGQSNSLITTIVLVIRPTQKAYSTCNKPHAPSLLLDTWQDPFWLEGEERTTTLAQCARVKINCSPCNFELTPCTACLLWLKWAWFCAVLCSLRWGLLARLSVVLDVHCRPSPSSHLWLLNHAVCKLSPRAL